jgi:predicted phage tail protein
MPKIGLPGISSKLPADVRQFLEKVREAFTGGNAPVTVDELRRAGVIDVGRNGSVIPVAGSLPDLSTPPAPTGLTANGAMTNILVEWDSPGYNNHSHTEIWAAGVDDIGQRQLVGTAQGVLFAHSLGPDSTRYYWVRFVSTSDVTGPFNAIAGVLGETSKDPAFLLGVLSGQITESQLYADLNSRIDLIDTSGGLVDYQSDWLGGGTWMPYHVWMHCSFRV